MVHWWMIYDELPFKIISRIILWKTKIAIENGDLAVLFFLNVAI